MLIMATLTKQRIDSAHWYDIDGKPCHTQVTKAGGTRPTNLRDARKYGLFPSVTGIISILSKPGLEKWKLKQVALAAFNTEKKKDESEESRLNRALNSAFEQVDLASDFGTKVHEVIERHFKEGAAIPDGELLLPTGVKTDYHTVIDPVVKFHDPLTVVESEIRVVNKDVGFAGTMDEAFVYGDGGIGVLDFKTRRTESGQKVVSYPGQAMQIAAYGATYWADKLNTKYEDIVSRMIGANLYISSTEPGRFDVVKYKGDQLLLEWNAFVLCAALWRWMKKYDPRKQEEPVPPPPPPPPPTMDPEHDNVVIHSKEEKPDTSDLDDVFEKSVTLPDGKYKGTSLDLVPKSYLRRYVLASDKYADQPKLLAAVRALVGGVQ